MDPKQKLTDYSRRGIFSDGQLFPKHVTRVFPSELEPESHHNKKLKWESILAMNQDLGICSKIELLLRLKERIFGHIDRLRFYTLTDLNK